MPRTPSRTAKGPRRHARDKSDSGRSIAGAAGSPRPEVGIDDLEMQLLIALQTDQGGPVGARLATRRLRERGITVSEATVSRLLKRLDDGGLTVRTAEKGRVPTELGRRVSTRYVTNQRRNTAFHEALDSDDLDRLRELLLARRGVEREAARLAAERASKDETKAIADSLEHERQLIGREDRPAREFHIEVARVSASPIFIALADTLLSTSMEFLEEIADVITGGSREQSIEEHTVVLRCIEEQDADGAEAAMVRHMDRLIDEVENFSRSVSTSALSGLIRLTQQSKNASGN